MKVIITGGSGFIGTRLTEALLDKGHQVTIFDLHPSTHDVRFIKIDLVHDDIKEELLRDGDAIIHLAGRNIFSRWNEKVKREIYDSRVLAAKNLVVALKHTLRKPRVLISASAVGYYGDGGDEVLDESSEPGNDFLARVSIDWEKEVKEAEKLGIRTVQVRTAPVLGRGGLLASIAPIYKLGLGGPIASGRQWFPWIHIVDLVRIYTLAFENERIQGPINACTPGKIRYQEFSGALAKVLKRPAFFKVPKWALKLLYNDLADSMVISQRAHPEKLVKQKFVFFFPDIKKALEDIFS